MDPDLKHCQKGSVAGSGTKKDPELKQPEKEEPISEPQEIVFDTRAV